jgi:hypothetical protein
MLGDPKECREHAILAGLGIVAAGWLKGAVIN